MTDRMQEHHSSSQAAPGASPARSGRVSVIMANRNGEPYLERAIRSVLDQTHGDLELIVSDDGSGDGSLGIIRQAMARDPRVRLIDRGGPHGPGAARNRALAEASGEWVAICDSDDIMHPERLERLLKAARALKADIVADDLIYFGEDPLENHGTLLQRLDLQGPQIIDALALVTGRLCGEADLSFGYLKPLIRSAALGDLRYTESLRIDEDYDLYLRLLLAGRMFMVIPDALYLYRRHPKSTSHRASAESLERMVQVQAAFLRDLPAQDSDVARAIRLRMQSHAQEMGYAHLQDALKQRKWFVAAGRLLRSPRHFLSLWRSLMERTRRKRLRQSLVRTPLNLVLCQKGRAAAARLPGFTSFEVPERSDAPWASSAAGTWADLASLACEHDLNIIAADRSGEFALGLVPQFASAEVRYLHHTASDTAAPAGASSTFLRPDRVQEGA